MQRTGPRLSAAMCQPKGVLSDLMWKSDGRAPGICVGDSHPQRVLSRIRNQFDCLAEPPEAAPARERKPVAYRSQTKWFVNSPAAFAKSVQLRPSDAL
jgi:hypothetical protein